MTESAALNFLAVGPYCWGRGRTIEEAVKHARQNWPRAYHKIKRPQAHHFSLYTSTGTLSCDGMGYVRSTANDIQKIQTSSLATP